MDLKKKLICRHCKGDHLSIQCPDKIKNKKSVVLNINKKNTYQQKILARISPLPKDISKRELADLLTQWGPIGNIFIQNDRSTGLVRATIEFKKKDQGLKAIYQLNKTNFDHLIINVEEINTNNYY